MKGLRDVIFPAGGGTAAGGVAITAAGASASAGTVLFQSGNGVTFGMVGSTITASVAAVGGAQTGISGIVVSDATYTSGTVLFSNLGNVTISSSVNGASQYIGLSGHAAQTVQPVAVSAANGLANFSTLSFSNLNGVSFVTAAGPAIQASVRTDYLSSGSSTRFVQAAAAFAGTNATGTIASDGISVSVAASHAIQTGISGIIVSDATYTSGTVSFSGVGAITVSSSVNGASQYIRLSVAAQTAATGISGIIVSDASYTSGTVSFSNQANITIGSSVNGATQYIRLSGNAAQTVQSAIKAFGASNTGNTAGNTGVSSGIDWVIAGTNNITVSESTAVGGPNTLWLSGAAGAGATAISGIIVSDATYTSGTVSFSGLGNITISSSVNGASQYIRLSVAAQTAQSGISGIIVSDATYTTGTVSFSNQGNVTIGSSVNGATQYIRLSVAAQTNQSAIKGLGVSNTGNTAGNTGMVSGVDWVVAGSNNITASQSTAVGGPNTIWISGPAVGGLQTAISGMIVSDATYTSGTVSFSGIGVTVSSSVNGASQYIRLSVPAGASATGNLGAIAVNAVTTYTSGTVVFSNSNGVSFGTNAQTITASVAAGIGVGVSTGGNTAGSTGTVNSGNVIFVGSGPISLSQSTGAAGSAATITINAPATSSLVGTLGITLSTAGSTISIQPVLVSSFENQPGLVGAVTMTLAGASISHCVAFEVPGNISVSFLRIPVLMTTNSTTIATMASATASASGAIYSTWNAVVYSMGVGASSRSLQSVASGSNGWTLQNNISVTNSTQASHTLAFSANAMGAGTTRSTQYSVSNTNYSFTTNQIATEWSSARMLDIAFANSLTAGNYWLVLGLSTSSASAGAAGLAALTNCNVRYSAHYGVSQTDISFGIMGSTNLSTGGLLGAGSFSTAGGGTTNSIPISAICSSSAHARLYFQLHRSA